MAYKFSAVLILLINQSLTAQVTIPLNDLSSFADPGKTWMVAGSVKASLDQANMLRPEKGTGILVNDIGKTKEHGKDLFTNQSFSDFNLELDYLMAKNANSGIYLQGRYELQLSDDWGDSPPTQSSNGAIYPRWKDGQPEGYEGYDGHAARMNVSKAPGTWQHLRVSFQAPQFDANGNKTVNAKLISVELNGVLIHENLQLEGPTRGSIDDKEVAKGPLRFQGDHGAVAFRNIKITEGAAQKIDSAKFDLNDEPADPIMITANTNKIHRSFMDLPLSGRLTHTISVGTTEKVHFTYDPMTGTIVQVWRGEFLDATPMWHERGDGSSKPAGAVIYLGKPAPALGKLDDQSSSWPADTTNTAFKPLGYLIDPQDLPTFRYQSMGSLVEDRIRPLEKGKGFTRELSIENPQPSAYFRIASAGRIEKLNDGLYAIDDQSYYLQTDKNTAAALIVRDGSDGMKELIIPAKNKINYTILF